MYMLTSQGTLTKSIKENGGKVSAKITISTTHLVASEKDYESQTVKGQSLVSVLVFGGRVS